MISIILNFLNLIKYRSLFRCRCASLIVSCCIANWSASFQSHLTASAQWLRPQVWCWNAQSLNPGSTAHQLCDFGPLPCPTLAFPVTFTLLYFSSVLVWPDTHLCLHTHLHVCKCMSEYHSGPIGVCVCAQSLRHVQLFVTACSLPGSPVHATSQAGTLEWVAISSSRGSSRPRDPTHVSWVSCTGKWILYPWATGKATWT